MLPACEKLLEIVIYKQFNAYVKRNKVLREPKPDSQFFGYFCGSVPFSWICVEQYIVRCFGETEYNGVKDKALKMSKNYLVERSRLIF